jgi:hypothetical protein
MTWITKQAEDLFRVEKAMILQKSKAMQAFFTDKRKRLHRLFCQLVPHS